MTPKSKRTRTGLRFLGMLKNAINMDESGGAASLCHRLPVVPPGGDLPTTFTVYLTPDDQGIYLATCRELPAVVAFGESEEEALTRAEQVIQDALGGGRSSSDFPY
jgi:predicted RNase H-like HicB family nuclease